MYKINKLCGVNDYSVIFDRKIEIDKVLIVFKDYNILEKNNELVRLSKNDKKILIYDYGEIIFINFSIDEVEIICNEIEKILK